MNNIIRQFVVAIAATLLGAAPSLAHQIAFDLAGKAGAGLLSGNENGTINGTPGSGGEVGTGIVFNDETNVLTINVGWGSTNGFANLSGDARAGHIHGPTPSTGAAAFNENAGILIGLDDKPGWTASASAGGFSGSVTLSAEQVQHLFAGRLYINVHTQTNGGGEIRGNLVQPPFDPANPIPARIPLGPVRVELQQVASGLVSPTLLISAPDGTNRQFILDQPGKVWVIENGTMRTTPFLDVSARLVPLNPNFDERGLLGLAFDPSFNDPASVGHRRIFTYTSELPAGTPDFPNPYLTQPANNHSIVASWRVSASDPNTVDPNSRQELMRIEDPQANHNGGHMAFGPDGFLYLAIGDGGGANDTNPNGHNPTTGNGQDPNIILGKIVRIDVNGTNSANGKYGIPPTNPFAMTGGLKEIFALGFRNPYRFSFNGPELLVGDVGQRSVEELNRVELGKNYGWRLKEGTFKFNPADGTVTNDLSGLPADLVDPIAQYDRDEGISIIGGFVYNGTGIPGLQGKYIFADFAKPDAGAAGRLFYYDFTAAEIREFVIGRASRPLGLYVKGMGLDQNGEIYVLGALERGPTGTTGVVYRLTAVPSQPVNISTRVRVETGENAMIGGFIVSGTAQKNVIVRALGPSLAPQNVAGVLADPVLELRGPDGALIATNDNWKNTQETQIVNSGLSPQNDAEAAIIASLPATPHTAIVTGKNDTSGVGLVEIYDLDELAASRLANISTRGSVQTGANVMIAGVIVAGGNGLSKVVLRAIGPSLSDDGIANPLADPILELYDGNGTLAASNDNWKENTAQAAEITAANLAPKNDLEAALIANMAPGLHTAIVSGKGETTGVGLVEAYHLQ